MLGKNFEFEDINFRNVFNVHYVYLYIVTFKINYSTQLYSIKKFFYSSICINTLKRIERQSICLCFFSNINPTFYV